MGRRQKRKRRPPRLPGFSGREWALFRGRSGAGPHGGRKRRYRLRLRDVED